MRRCLLQIILSLLSAGVLQAQPVTWVPTAGPRGGDAGVVVSAEGTVLLGLSRGWSRSTDGGTTWTPLPDILGAVWAAPDGLLWAGSRDGVYRSADDGRTWQQIALAGQHVRTVRVQGDGTLWVRTDSLLRSPDGGATWLGAMAGLDDLQSNCPLAFLTAAADGAMYAGTTACGPYASGSLLARWDPATARWILLYGDASRLNGSFIRVLRATDGTLWAAAEVGYFYDDGGLYRVVDGEVIRVASGAHLSLAEAPDGRFLAGTARGLRQSTDGGQTWTETGLEGLPVRSLAFAPDGTLYAGTASYCYPALDPPIPCVRGFGAYVQRPGETTWTPLEPGRPSAHVVALAAGANGVWAGTLNGLWRTEDRGAAWQHLPAGYDASAPPGALPHPFDLFFEPQLLHETAWGTLLASGAFEQALYRYLPDCPCWAPLGVPLYYLTRTADVLSRPPQTLLVVANGRVYRSADDGVTWATALEEPVDVLAHTPGGGLLAGGEGLWRSEDDGQTWAAVDGAPSPIWTLAEAREDHLYASTNQQLYRSADDGQTWTLLGDQPGLRQLLVDADEHLFGRLWNGAVAASVDGGLTWDTLATGLPDRAEIVTLALDADSYLYAGTEAHGVWRSEAPTAVARRPVSTPPAARSLTGFPNPFAERATVRFALPRAAAVHLAVYDLLGRRVALLADRSYSAGTHTVRLDGTALPAGIYLVRLTADGAAQSIRLTLLR